MLSLFFIDRVANYTAKDGIIRRIFDEEFERTRSTSYPFYAQMEAEEVRSAYFAKSKPKKGETKARPSTPTAAIKPNAKPKKPPSS